MLLGPGWPCAAFCRWPAVEASESVEHCARIVRFPKEEGRGPVGYGMCPARLRPSLTSDPNGARRERQARAAATSSAAPRSPRPTAVPPTSSTPAPARCSPPRRCPSEADVDRAYRAAAEAFEAWRDSTPVGAAEGDCWGSPTLLEQHADELVALESENTGKPIGLTASEEIPPMIDQIRFFAGAARVLEGRAAGEYMAGHTSMIRREPIGVIGQVTPWNYPMMMAVWKFAPAIAAGNTVVAQALGHHAGHHGADGRADQRGRAAAARASSTSSAATATPAVPSSSTGSPQMVAITGSVRAGMEVAEVGLVATSSASTSSSAARLRSSSSTTPTSRPPPKAIAVAGYFNAGQDCTAATRVLASGASTTTSSRPSPSRPRTPRPRSRTAPATRTRWSRRSTTSTSWRGCRRSSNACRRTPRWTRAASGRATVASTSSPRSSPACGRTTR